MLIVPVTSTNLSIQRLDCSGLPVAYYTRVAVGLHTKNQLAAALITTDTCFPAGMRPRCGRFRQ